MHEILAVLLERRHCIQTIFIILRDEGSGTRNDHGAERFITAREFFGGGVEDGDEVGFEVVGVLDNELGRDNRDEGFGGEVAGLFAGQGLEVGF